MRRHLLQAVRELMGRGNSVLVAAIRDQVAAAREGAALTTNVMTGDGDFGVIRKEMKRVEHRGDDARERLVVALSQSVATIIDREDLFRLSRSIDDILDALRDLVRQTDMYQIRNPGLADSLKAVEAALELLDAASGALDDELHNIPHLALAAKKSSSQVLKACQQGTAVLLTESVTPALLQRLELFRRLERVGEFLNQAADALADGAMKRGV